MTAAFSLQWHILLQGGERTNGRVSGPFPGWVELEPIWGSHSHSDVAAAKSFAGSVRSIPSNRSAHKSRCKSEKRGHNLHKRGICKLDSLVGECQPSVFASIAWNWLKLFFGFCIIPTFNLRQTPRKSNMPIPLHVNELLIWLDNKSTSQKKSPLHNLHGLTKRTWRRRATTDMQTLPHSFLSSLQQWPQ